MLDEVLFMEARVFADYLNKYQNGKEGTTNETV